MFVYLCIILSPAHVITANVYELSVRVPMAAVVNRKMSVFHVSILFLSLKQSEFTSHYNTIA